MATSLFRRIGAPCAALGVLFVSSALASGPQETTSLQRYAQLPLSFEKRGPAEFVARGDGYSMHLLGRKALVRTVRERSRWNL